MYPLTCLILETSSKGCQSKMYTFDMAKYKYGAEIIGSCPTYLFKRHFFKRTGKDTFNVADGIYELSRKSDHGKEYYRVTGDDCIAITQDEAKTAVGIEIHKPKKWLSIRVVVDLIKTKHKKSLIVKMPAKSDFKDYVVFLPVKLSNYTDVLIREGWLVEFIIAEDWDFTLIPPKGSRKKEAKLTGEELYEMLNWSGNYRKHENRLEVMKKKHIPAKLDPVKECKIDASLYR